jgi:hypothetical protein
MLEHCPVAHSTFLGWSVFRHDDIAALLHTRLLSATRSWIYPITA